MLISQEDIDEETPPLASRVGSEHSLDLRCFVERSQLIRYTTLLSTQLVRFSSREKDLEFVALIAVVFAPNVKLNDFKDDRFSSRYLKLVFAAGTEIVTV